MGQENGNGSIQILDCEVEDVNKKRGTRIIALLLISTALVLSAVACGSQSTESAQTGREPLDINMLGASPTGTLYMVLSGISECVNKSYPGSVVTLVPGNFKTNVDRINSNQGDSGMTDGIMASAAIEGIAPYEKKMDNIAGVASLYQCQFQFVVSEDLGVTSFKEIIENKMKVTLAVDTFLSSPGIALERIFTEYGVSPDDFEAWGGKIVFYNMSDSCRMLADGSIDGLCVTAPYPTRPVQEAAVAKDLVFLDIEPEILDSLVNKYGYQEAVIPAGSYEFQPKDVKTLGSRLVLIVPKSSPDEVAYKLVTSISENLEYLKSVHVALGGLTLDTMSSDIGVPLHPGAKKYYDEQE